MRFHRLLLLLLLCWSPVAFGVANAPAPTSEHRQQAEGVLRLDDSSPPDRLVRLLEALKLEREALFVVAGPDPVLASQVVDPRIRMALDYVDSLPATRKSELRGGGTAVRTSRTWSARELERLQEMASELGVKKPKKLESVRIGTITGRNMKLELVGAKGRADLEFAWATAPEREERARRALTRHFGARPEPITAGPGTRLPLVDPSFEDPARLGSSWILEPLVEKGGKMPAVEVTLDDDMVMDGRHSLRFHSNSNTRYWPQVTQRVAVEPGLPLVLRGHAKASYVRQERDQERIFHIGIVFEDLVGDQVGPAHTTPLLTGDMDWRAYTVKATVPEGADYAKIVVACTMSGLAWFDGLSLSEGYR